jgi:hypothetical protein
MLSLGSELSMASAQAMPELPQRLSKPRGSVWST